MENQKLPDWVGKFINRRVIVEETLWAVASGKRDLLSREECRNLAKKLGVPEEFKK